MADHARIVHQVETTVDTIARQAADDLYKHLSSNAEKLTRQPSDLTVTQQEWDDLYLPAVLWKMFHHLARALDSGAQGWAQVFWTKLNEEYADGNDEGQ